MSFKLNVIMVNAIMVNAIMVNVILLNVVALFRFVIGRQLLKV